MCFIYDYDWYPEDVEVYERVSDGTTLCEDCCRKVPAGQAYTRTNLREYEDCRGCEEICCACDYPDHGHTASYAQCQDCRRLRRAIRSLEREEGCRPSQSEPPVGMLFEALSDTDDPWRYLERAARDFPELTASGYLEYARRTLEG